MSDDTAEGWGGFASTVLHFDIAHPFSVDLRTPVTPEQLLDLGRIGLGRPFGVVSAEDPMGVTQPPDVNLVRSRKLERDAVNAAASCVAIDACSPDHSHCERSIAIPLAVGDVVALAREYDQLAIFWFDGSSFWIIPACSRKRAVRLPDPGLR